MRNGLPVGGTSASSCACRSESSPMVSGCSDVVERWSHELTQVRSDGLPTVVYRAPQAVILDAEYARDIGIALLYVQRKMRWPRRKLVNRLHNGVDVRIDEGLILRDTDSSVIDFHDDYLDETLKNDPSFRWVSSFASACERQLKNAPRASMYERLSRLDLALRAVGLKRNRRM